MSKNLIEFLKMSRVLVDHSVYAALVTKYNPNKIDFDNYIKKLHEITLELSDEEIKEVYPEGLRR